ncbi:MAG: translation initiation factor IF-6 [Candidatus Hermodarchaeota archaeon]|nr:translation initiation factor IF-6 [Candidatus Hermodarchaeota archaeon]
MIGKVQRLAFDGSSNIGAFSRVSENWLLLAPSDFSTAKDFVNLFSLKATTTTIGHSTLVGILTVGNQNGLLVPHIVFDEEIKALETELELPVHSLQSKLTALGNLILTNDHAALVSPKFSKTDLQNIRDVLGVEVEVRQLASSDLVGSHGVVTNKGLLAHTSLTGEELEWLANFFGVGVEVGTINCGVPYLSIGLLVTGQAAAAGIETTGPELMRITEAFF